MKHKVNNKRINPDDIWIGVVWDDPSWGNHKGIVKGVKYFECSENESGSLLWLKWVSVGDDILTGYIKKYFKGY